jgi:hypothetical protein
MPIKNKNPIRNQIKSQNQNLNKQPKINLKKKKNQKKRKLRKKERQLEMTFHQILVAHQQKLMKMESQPEKKLAQFKKDISP